MRKAIKIIIAILILSIVIFLGYNIYQKIQHKQKIAENTKTIPSFNFKTIESVDFTLKDISSKKPKLFIYFNSECEFCNGEAEKISENLDLFNDIQILFVSHEETQNILRFAQKHHLYNRKNIIFLEDEKLEFSKLFDAKSIPFIVLYSKEDKRIKVFKGSTNPKKILTYLPE